MGDESEFVAWLLAAKTPSVRYFTLRDLLDVPANDPRLQAEQHAIMTQSPVTAILERQTSAGHWANEHSYYTPKYRSTHWSLILLTELHADPQCDAIQRGVSYMLDTTAPTVNDNLRADARGWSCLWGNILHYAAVAGFAADARLQAMIEYAVRDLLDDNCTCRYNENKSCAWGVVRTLWGIAALPDWKHDPRVREAVDHALEFLLTSHHLNTADYPTPERGKVHPMWSALNFPLFYQADKLFTLRVLMTLDQLDHPGAAAALDGLESKRGANGRWRGSSPFRSMVGREFADPDETSRWVSLHTAHVLKGAGRLTLGGFFTPQLRSI